MGLPRIISIYYVLPILISWLFATPSAAQLHIQNFGIAEGLPQSQVSSIAEDSQGYLWIGTLGGGLSRFDGKTFETFTTTEGLINNFVQDVVIDTVGRIWMATYNGISMFDGIEFHNLVVKENNGVFVKYIFTSGKDILYLMRNGELGKVWYDSMLHKQIISRIDNLKSVHKTPNGKTIILKNDHGKSALQVIGYRNSVLLNDVKFNDVHSVFNDKGSIVLSTNGGLFVLDSLHVSELSPLKNPVYGFDAYQKRFIGTSHAKIATISLESGIFEESNPVNYLILSSFNDREGNLWLGTDQGLFKIYPYDFENPLTDNDRQNAINAMSFHERKLWVGTTYRGIKVYENHRLIKEYDLGSKTRNYVNVIKEDKRGRLWIGTLGGIALFEKNEFQWQNKDVVRSVVAFDWDNEDNLLVAGSGLFLLANGKAESIPEFKSNEVWSIKYNRENNYFAIGTNVGLKTYKRGIINSVDIKDFAGKEISSLDWFDRNTLVLGTLGDGMFIYSFKTNSLVKMTTQNGLASNTVFFVFVDHGNIWTGTEKGIDLIQFNQSKNQMTKIDHFNDEDGLLGLETNLNAVIKKDSTLLFGLVKGLYRYTGKRSISAENRIHLKGINLFYQPFHDPRMNQGFSIDTSLMYSFKHDQNHLTFLFNKVNKRKPSTYFYTHKLTDFDQIWSQPSQLNSITYSNLSPGTYTLEVRATDKVSAFVFDRAKFHFEILPAYYQTIYFKMMIVVVGGLFILLVAYLLYRTKTNRAIAIQTIKDNEKARLRKEIARDFHDELGNQVARMINYVGLLRISQKLERDVYQTLNTYSQSILNGAKDFVWALDPKNDDLGSVLVHLKDFGERMFSEKNIQFSFHGNLPDTKLPMGYGRQINLIFKEAMTNAFKHAEAKSVDLTFISTTLKGTTITLRDDGKGMDKNKIENSESGMENMRIRAHKINSHLSIQSNGNGMEIKLNVVLPENAV